MEHIIPFFQTLLWVGLIAYVLWRYGKNIEGILTSLQKEIESGRGIKAGSFELSPPVKPQDVKQQARKLDEEVTQLVKSERDDQPSTPPPTAAQRQDIKIQYLKAEDFALRELQAEFQTPINRQIQIGNASKFDGAFIKDKELYVVEIKYFRSTVPMPLLRQTVTRFISKARRHNWTKVHLVIGLVFESSRTDFKKRQEHISQILRKDSEGIDIIVRCYDLEELAKKYGIES